MRSMSRCPRQLSNPADAAAYLASFATDLAILTHKAGLPSLEFLLEILRLEAENLNRPSDRRPASAD
jgi:hypothetical protein